MKRPLRWLLVCTGLVVVLAGAGFWIAHRRADETFEENARIIEEMIAQHRGRAGPRPTIGEPSAEGEAWDVYRPVLERVAKLSARDREVSSWLNGFEDADEEPTQAESDAWFARTGRILRDLEPALKAPILGPLGAFEHPYEQSVEWIPHWQELAWTVTAHMERLRERGQIGAALDLAVLRAFAGLDLMRHGGAIDHLVGMGIARVSTSEIEAMLAEAPIEPLRLEKLAAELATLRRMRGSLESVFRVTEINIRRMLQDPHTFGDTFDLVDEPAAGMRYLYSQRLKAADALEGLPAYREAFLKVIGGKPGPAARHAAEALLEEIKQDPNPLMSQAFAIHPLLVRRTGQFDLHLNLLQVAVALARFQSSRGSLPAALSDLVPDFLASVPPCPYTAAPLRHARGKVWSIGGDGVDDGGTPIGEDDDADSPGDVVLSVFDPKGVRRVLYRGFCPGRKTRPPLGCSAPWENACSTNN